MKTMSTAILAFSSLMVPVLFAAPTMPSLTSSRAAVRSSTYSSNDRLMKVGDQMVIVSKERAKPMTAEVTLANGTRVAIDGTVISKNGSRMKLRDCGVIGFDGRRKNDASGQVVMVDGRVMIMKGGLTKRLEMSAPLGDGRSVSGDGMLTDASGGRHEINEGEIIAMNPQRGSANDGRMAASAR